MVYFEKPLDGGDIEPEDFEESDEEEQDRQVQQYVAWLHDLKWSLPVAGESPDAIEAPETAEEQV